MLYDKIGQKHKLTWHKMSYFHFQTGSLFREVGGYISPADLLKHVGTQLDLEDEPMGSNNSLDLEILYSRHPVVSYTLVKIYL